jgi:hypothetical protein
MRDSARRVLPILQTMLDAELSAELVQRFADRVMRSANLPTARRSDVENAPAFHVERAELRCTCTITGSTYGPAWDGSREGAFALADEAAEGTSGLLSLSPHYAWLRSSRR